MSDANDAREETRGCPICGRPMRPAERPFCSRRCANIDLHRWLGGVYAIPAEPADDDLGPGEALGDD